MSPLGLLDADALACVAAHLPATDAFPTALACRALRDALRARFPDGFRSCKTAAFAGSVARAQWALAHGVVASSRRAVHAPQPFRFDCAERHMARAGHWDVVAWALEAGVWSWDHDKGAIFDTLARHGHVDVLERFRERGDFCWSHSHSAMSEAASHGQREALEWLRDVCASRDSHTGDRPPFEWRTHDMRCAVVGGHVDLVRWMQTVDRRAELDIYHAARSGSLPMIEYAWEDLSRHRPGELTRMTTDPWRAGIFLQRAAERGSLAAVQWLVAKGFTPDYHAVATAVACDNWEVAAWLAEAVGWDTVRAAAAAAGHEPVRAWAASERAPPAECARRRAGA